MFLFLDPMLNPHNPTKIHLKPNNKLPYVQRLAEESLALRSGGGQLPAGFRRADD